MLYKCKINGISPIIMHNGMGIDPSNPLNAEKRSITSKRGGNRTASDDARLQEIDVELGLWLDATGQPEIPPRVVKAMLLKAATKLKQGPLVREQLIIKETIFTFDTKRYGTTLAEWCKSTPFTVPVVVQRNRTMSTRPMFECPWSLEALIDCDDDGADDRQLRQWLEIGGHRIGMGDWRPQLGGEYGRFEVESLTTQA